MVETQDVLFDITEGNGGNLGIVTLNRPKVLNSLNHQMIKAMHPKLNEWQNDASIKAVVVRAAEGRAFCAGGDLRLTYDRAKAGHPTMTEFFNDEYQLNRTINHYKKPYIALLDGITMGGGVGISIHGSHRVATENLLFAMPETGIGLFPDVGGTYFLPRLPGAIGYYLGLTGARIKADDATAIGLTTHTIASKDIDVLISSLADQEYGEDAKNTVSQIIAKIVVDSPQSSIMDSLSAVDCFKADTIENLIKHLEAQSDDLSMSALKILAKKSPTSLKVTLQALKSGEALSFNDCMRQEFRLVTRFLLEHDFIEGIRAVIIDKDQSPNWKPKLLIEVDEKTVNNYFFPLHEELA